MRLVRTIEQIEQERNHHVTRARAELDAAYRSPDRDSAQIHLRLAALHAQKARATIAREGASPSADLDWIERCWPLHSRLPEGGRAWSANGPPEPGARSRGLGGEPSGPNRI